MAELFRGARGASVALRRWKRRTLRSTPRRALKNSREAESYHQRGLEIAL